MSGIHIKHKDLIHGEWYEGDYAGGGMKAVMCYNSNTGYFARHTFEDGRPMGDSGTMFQPTKLLQWID